MTVVHHGTRSASKRVVAHRREAVAAQRYSRASDAGELERSLKGTRPRFVLADVDLPRKRGTDLLRRVAGRAVVVLVDLSAGEQASQVASALERLHAVGVLHRDLKPDNIVLWDPVDRPPTVGGSLEELHDPATGRLDAGRIAAWLGVSLTRLSRFLGRPVQTVHKTPAGVSLQADLGVFARVATSLLALLGDREHSRAWLNAPNADLDRATPMALFGKGKAEIVAELLEDALLGHPG